MREKSSREMPSGLRAEGADSFFCGSEGVADKEEEGRSRIARTSEELAIVDHRAIYLALE
jgi:hypothetical protein